MNKAATSITKKIIHYSYTAEDISTIMGTNFKSVYHLTQLVHVLLKEFGQKNIVNKSYKILNEHQNTLHHIIKRFQGIPGSIKSLINTHRNLTMVTNNLFNDLSQPNHFFLYGTFVFSLDGEMRNYLLIWYILNQLGFPLSPNEPNWFQLINPISIINFLLAV